MPLLARRRIGHRKHDGEAGDPARGDELLGAVEPVAALDPLRPRAHRRRVGAGVGLGQRERADHAAGDQIGQEALPAASAVPSLSRLETIRLFWIETIVESAPSAAAISISASA